MAWRIFLGQGNFLEVERIFEMCWGVSELFGDGKNFLWEEKFFWGLNAAE